MVCFPNAKINLGLHIIEKRSDGFHDIETVFYPVAWCDVLESIRYQDTSIRTEVSGIRTKENKIEFTSSGIGVDVAAENNLCVKAFQLLDQKFNLPAVKMHLHKIIPMGAGLGGGSADAAFTLKLLNDLFDLKQSHNDLKIIATQLGSDCSFFIDNTPAFASGRGEVLETLQVNLKGFFILIVKPAVHVSTADAYANVKPAKPSQSLREIIKLPVGEWKSKLKNDFEESVFAKHPLIAAIKNKLYTQGAVYASMSGSGSSVFGIFEKKSFVKEDFKECVVWDGILK